ncbi:MAG: beta-lactamase family protein [Oscillatoriales cyanobacterium SM2_2_1]|nr:beta-lactamase family protein [Oscillatoriales cyanobacterium SM2_2_1]
MGDRWYGDHQVRKELAAMAIRRWCVGLALLAAIALVWIHGVAGEPLAQGASSNGATEIRNFLDKAPIPSLQLAIYDGTTNRLLFEHRKGSFNPRQTLAVASASKWVTSAVIMAMASNGVLQPTDTTSKWLNWQGTPGTITLQHLLSFTSGLNQGVLCLLDHRTSLERCTAQVYRASRTAQPERFLNTAAPTCWLPAASPKLLAKKAGSNSLSSICANP